jgi:hypothetical protein
VLTDMSKTDGSSVLPIILLMEGLTENTVVIDPVVRLDFMYFIDRDRGLDFFHNI